MHILVTNDDGFAAPGLLALAQQMRTLGEVSVLAPDRNWSASGHVKTMQRPLRVKDVNLSRKLLMKRPLTDFEIAVKSVGMIDRIFPPPKQIRPGAQAPEGVFFHLITEPKWLYFFANQG